MRARGRAQLLQGYNRENWNEDLLSVNSGTSWDWRPSVMKKTILFWFLIAIITASPVAMAGDDFNFDHSDAADYGAGILKSLLHAPWKDQASLSSFDMTKPILEAIKSKDEKRFIFVGFRVATG